MSSGADKPFRDTIAPGTRFEPEANRYHLYVSYACPWATRAILMRKLKGLDEIVGMSVVSPHLGPKGWVFANIDPFPKAEVDTVNHASYMSEIYHLAKPDYEGSFSVPILWDKKLKTIVNNESAELVRIFNSGFNSILPADKAALDFYPKDLQPEIDELNNLIGPNLNSGVYAAGLAKTQAGYDSAVQNVFGALDKVEKHLEGKDYLVGNRLTEADVRLFVTIIRFDPVYVSPFKCSLRTIREGYPAIYLWVRKLYWNNDIFKSTTDFDHIKGLYWTQDPVNPSKIVPLGPDPYIHPL